MKTCPLLVPLTDWYIKLTIWIVSLMYQTETVGLLVVEIVCSFLSSGSVASPSIQLEMYTSQGRVRTFTPLISRTGGWWRVFSM